MKTAVAASTTAAEAISGGTKHYLQGNSGVSGSAHVLNVWSYLERRTGAV